MCTNIMENRGETLSTVLWPHTTNNRTIIAEDDGAGVCLSITLRTCVRNNNDNNAGDEFLYFPVNVSTSKSKFKLGEQLLTYISIMSVKSSSYTYGRRYFPR